MSQIKFRKKALARLAVFCLGTSALVWPVIALRVLAIAAVLLPATPVLAQTTSWNGGTGSWFAGGNWSAGMPGPASDANVAAGTAQISGSTGTIQSLTIFGSGAVDLQTSGTLSTTNGIFIGNGSTPGTLLLSGSNNLSGPITIAGGTLSSQVNGTLSNAITVDPSTGGFLSVQSGKTLTLSGPLSGYPLDIIGGGTVILTGSANAVSIGSGATFQVGNGGTSGSLGSSSIVNGLTLNNGTLIYNHSDDVAIPTFITGGGTLVQAGSGKLFITSSSAASLAIISSGSMVLTGSGGFSIGPGSGIIDNAILDISGISSSNISTGTLSGSGSVLLGTKSLTLLNSGGAFFGVIGGSGSLNISMTGTQILGGTNTYTGVTTISVGTLQIGNGGTTGSISGSSTILNNGVLAINRSDSYLLNNTMSGSGSVEFIGTGTLIVSSLPAPTTMRSGTLRVNNLLGPASLTMLDGTTLIAPQHNIEGTAISLQGNVTFSNVGEVLTAPITDGSGPGRLIVANGSILSLLGANTYSGGTTIQSGSTLNLGAAHFTAAGSVQGAIVNNGLLQVITEVNTTFNNAVSGTGQFQKTGAGVLTITSALTYTGGTAMDSGFTSPGTLRLGTGGRLPTGGAVSFVTTRDAMLDLNGHTQTIGALSYVPPQNQTTPAVSILMGGGTLTAGDGSSTIFAGAISGTGTFIKAGSGTLTLAGTSPFTGNTLVSAGTLSVTPYQPVNAPLTTASLTAGTITVQNGGTLAGTGTVGTTTVQSGGTLAPGNSIGTLTINGNLTLASGSAYSVEVSPTAADRIMVSGNASINGTVITSIAAGTYVPGQRFTILTATSGVSGTFASLTGIPITLKGQLSYDANNAYLTLSPTTLAPVLSNATGNQRSVVSAIDAAVVGGAVPGGGFVTLYGLSGSALNGALDQISGQVGPNTINAVGQASLSFLTMTAQGGSNSSNFAPGSAYGGADAPHRAQLGPGETRVWGAAYGGHVGLAADAASGAASLSASNVGMIGGIDMAWDGGFLAGITVGLGQQHFSSGNGTGSSDDVMIGVYARKDVGPLYVTAAIGYGSHHIETLRVITVSGTDVLQGKQHADDFGGRIEAGWRTALDDQFTLSPYFAVAAQSFESSAYTETAMSGASTFALSVAARSSTLGRTELGSGISREYETENGVMTADLRLAWAHQLDDVPLTQASFQTLPGASFLVAGVRPASDTALLGAGIQIQNRSGLFFGFKGETQLGAGTTILQGMGNLGWRW